MFRRAIEKLEQLSADPATRKAYESSINEQRDQLAVLASAKKEGLEKGREEGHKEGEKNKSLKIALAILFRKDTKKVH